MSPTAHAEFSSHAYTVAQIRAAEKISLDALPPGRLMARASHAIAVEASSMLGFTYGAKVILLVGGGDNGGDALYAGAALARRGAQVHAVLGHSDSVHRDGLQSLLAAGGTVTTTDGSKESDTESGPFYADLIIDGLLGIGASGPLRPALKPLVRRANESYAPILAVDLPSGVDADTGTVDGLAIRATVTVCPGAYKIGSLVGDGRLHAGRVRVVDIGVAANLVGDPALSVLGESEVQRLLPRPGPQDDKYTRGVVGVVAGSAEYPGAAQLAVGAARLGGVGAVRYAGHAAAEVSRRWSDVLVTETVSGAGRVQAWAVGPGLGSTDSARESLRRVLSGSATALIDADGLNLLATDSELRKLLERRSAVTVLTPHDREFVRLFGEIGPDRVGAARRAADKSGAIVLLKGFATVIAEPSPVGPAGAAQSTGRCFVNLTGSPFLATAGSGDVLSGLIGSLLATGIAPLEAAAVGAYLHGEAGSLAAERGPVTAPDLLEALRAVISERI